MSLRALPEEDWQHSGAFVHFHFCPECGSTVDWEVEATPGKTGIAVGVFADPTFPPPDASIFAPHRHPWGSIPEGIPSTKDTVPPSRPLRAATVARRSSDLMASPKQRGS